MNAPMNVPKNDHEKIRALLSLAAADALEPAEEQQLLDHLRTCDSCGAELEQWKLVASGLRRLPTPQPRALVVERARAQAQIRLNEEFEHRWNRAVIIGLIVFAWVLTLASWPLIRFISGGLLGMLDPRFNHAWITFGLFTTSVWIGGGAAAVLLSLQQRRERRLA
ncbi:MAG: zf-HC2 domain-containing protein [Candidatus Acidiferrales bacterium]